MDDASSRSYLRILALAVVAFQALIAAYIQLAPINFFDREYAVWSEQLRYARTPSESDPEILFLGDSRVRAALIPERISPDARSIALCGASTIDGYFVLRDYLEQHRAPKILVLSYAPYLMDSWNSGLFWSRSVKYQGHGLRDFLDLLARAEETGMPLGPGLERNQSLARWLLYRARFPIHYLPELKNARLFMRRKPNLEVAEAVREAAGHGYYGWADESGGPSAEARQEHFAPSPLVTGYLHDTIDLALRSNSTVLFRAMPLSESSYRQLEPSYAIDYRSYIKALQTEHPRLIAVEELDFLPDDHFGDRNHLNPHGATRFSERFRGELNQIEDIGRFVSNHGFGKGPKR
jgi:hypothetical protein